jgi:hypothetical protein
VTLPCSKCGSPRHHTDAHDQLEALERDFPTLPELGDLLDVSLTRITLVGPGNARVSGSASVGHYRGEDDAFLVIRVPELRGHQDVAKDLTKVHVTLG